MRHKRAIEKLSKAVRVQYGPAIRSIRVFGSVARGTADAGSDIDVMVILSPHAGTANWQMERSLRDVALPIELEEDVVFDLKVVAERDLRGLRGHTPFMECVAREGVSV